MEKTANNFTLSAAECAAQTGLTVRALRVYERYGLVTPLRTQKNWRVYGAKEMERLNEIIILKGFGLSLARIAKLLAGKEANIETILAVQTDILLRHREQINASLATITKLRGELSGGVISISTFIELAKGMTMTNTATDQIAWKRYEQARPRKETNLDAYVLTDYVGFFRLDDTTIISIKSFENGIEISLTGQPFFRLNAEGMDMFFSKQMPLQFTFERDKTGVVSKLTLHQNGMELPASRISEAEARIAEQRLETRVSGGIPLPTSERMLRDIISEAKSGIFNETRFSLELAQAIRDQMPVIAQEFAKLGDLKNLVFKGVASDGWDVYDVRFANGDQKWRIYMPDAHIVSGLFFQPSL